MRRTTRLLAAVPVAALAVGVLSPVAAGAAPDPEPAPRTLPALRSASGPETVTRLIVRTAPGTSVDDGLEVAVADAAEVSDAEAERRLAGGSTLVTLAEPVSSVDAWAAARSLEARDDVVSVEPDIRLFPAEASPSTPDDARFAEQWDLWDTTRPAGGFSARVPAAWARTTGAGQVVAVIDTGITAHPDLDDNVVAGYDFISSNADDPSALIANDGGGRDAVPIDPGDWITAEEADGTEAGGFFKGCVAGDSSWHGTHVAGTIAAVRGNATGIAGVAPDATVLAVRALGKCGGWLSDIADAIRWSAGGTVAGVPANPTPATVINLSLGGSGACSAYMQSAITAATGLGATVVVAAGNGDANGVGQSVSVTSTSPGSTPANCSGVVTVAATTRSGARASYSNFGTKAGGVALAAPGGDGAASILSTINLGTTTPGAAGYTGYVGTSMATPHVAGAAALIRAGSANPLSPAQVKARLQAYVTPFPAGSGCTTVSCGAGILDVNRAVAGMVQTASLPGGSALYPFADGYLDTISVRTLSETSVPGKVRIVTATGTLVREWVLPRATTTAISWNGTIATGRRVSAGTYRAQVLLANRDGVLTQVALLPLSVRTSQASAPSVALSSPTVYPVRDRFRDSVRITTKAGVPAAFTWRIVKNGKVRWAKTFTRRAAATASWRGVDRAGRRLPAGVYTLRVTARGGEGTVRTSSRRITISTKRVAAIPFAATLPASDMARYGAGDPKDPYAIDDSVFFPADSVVTFTRKLPRTVKPYTRVRIAACGARVGTTSPAPVLGYFAGSAANPAFYDVSSRLPRSRGCAAASSGPPAAALDRGTLRWYVANMRESGSVWRLDSVRITGTRYVLTR